MKVVFLQPPPYPVNIDFFNYLGQLVELSVFVFGAQPMGHTNWHIDSLKNNVKTFDLKVFGKGLLNFRNKINPFFVRSLFYEKPDIVVSVAFWPISLYAGFLKKILSYKFIILTNANFSTEQNKKYIEILYRKILSSFVDAYIAASPDTEKYLEFLCPNKKIFLSLQTIHVERWIRDISNLPDKYILRKELNLPLDKILLLGVGKLTKKKNWNLALRVLSRLDERFFLVLVGDGEEKNNILKFAKKLGVASKLILAGRQENTSLLAYYKASDIFVFPTHYDQFGYVVAEALASGLPVLCSVNAGARVLINDGINGFLIEPTELFVEKIHKIVNSLDNMKVDAINSIKKYSLKARANEFFLIFKRLLQTE